MLKWCSHLVSRFKSSRPLPCAPLLNTQTLIPGLRDVCFRASLWHCWDFPACAGSSREGWVPKPWVTCYDHSANKTALKYIPSPLHGLKYCFNTRQTSLSSSLASHSALKFDDNDKEKICKATRWRREDAEAFQLRRVSEPIVVKKSTPLPGGIRTRQPVTRGKLQMGFHISRRYIMSLNHLQCNTPTLSYQGCTVMWECGGQKSGRLQPKTVQ